MKIEAELTSVPDRDTGLTRQLQALPRNSFLMLDDRYSCLGPSSAALNWPAMMRHRMACSEDVTVICCKGRITYGIEAATLSGEIAELAPQTRRVVIDLSGVEMIDAAGLGALISVALTRLGPMCGARTRFPCVRPGTNIIRSVVRLLHSV